tara:strand:+ start:5075 stop:5458 length:384 start_codon:yes stop_codon:yes gene_type:complete
MSDSSVITVTATEAGQLQDYSVDQAAGAIVLVLGAIASLLLVVWQSKCHCKVNLCWIFQCERRPPSEEEMEGLKDQAQKLKDKKNNKPPAKKPIKKPIKKPKPDEEDPDYLSADDVETQPEPEINPV